LVDNLEEASEAFAEGASNPLPQHLASLSRGLRCCHCRLVDSPILQGIGHLCCPPTSTILVIVTIKRAKCIIKLELEQLLSCFLIFSVGLLHLEAPAFPSEVDLFLLEADLLFEADLFLSGELFLLLEVLRHQYHLNQNPSFWEEAFLYLVVLQVCPAGLQVCLVDLQVLRVSLEVLLPDFVVFVDLQVCLVDRQVCSEDPLACLVDLRALQACLVVLQPYFVAVASWVHHHRLGQL